MQPRSGACSSSSSSSSQQHMQPHTGTCSAVFCARLSPCISPIRARVHACCPWDALCTRPAAAQSTTCESSRGRAGAAPRCTRCACAPLVRAAAHTRRPCHILGLPRMCRECHVPRAGRGQHRRCGQVRACGQRHKCGRVGCTTGAGSAARTGSCAPASSRRRGRTAFAAHGAWAQQHMQRPAVHGATNTMPAHAPSLPAAEAWWHSTRPPSCSKVQTLWGGCSLAVQQHSMDIHSHVHTKLAERNS